MANSLTHEKIMDALDWAYDKAIAGAPGLDSAEELARDYLAGSGTLTERIDSLIRWQNTKAGTSGFITGLGGIITMPVTVPVNIASVIYVQIRMIAAIAIMCGQDVHRDQVKTLVYVCLTGNAAKDILKDAGVLIGTKVATNLINTISGKTIAAINKKVGFRLLAKSGEKSVINLAKAAPVLGGVIGGTVDVVATNLIGNIARDTFLPLMEASVSSVD